MHDTHNRITLRNKGGADASNVKGKQTHLWKFCSNLGLDVSYRSILRHIDGDREAARKWRRLGGAGDGDEDHRCRRLGVKNVGDAGLENGSNNFPWRVNLLRNAYTCTNTRLIRTSGFRRPRLLARAVLGINEMLGEYLGWESSREMLFLR